MDTNELREAANNVMALMSDGIVNLTNLGKFAHSKFSDQAINIYKGRHKNPIYRKMKGFERAVIDKIQPVDRLHLIDKLQKPVSQDHSQTDHSNYQVEVDGETVFQESTDGQVNINQVGQFISQLLSPELESEQESEREEFTIADAFSSEYDPPQNDSVQFESELEENQNDQTQPEAEQDTSPADSSPRNSQSEPNKNDLDAVYTVTQNDVKSIKSPGIVKLLQSTFSRLRDGIDKLNKTASRHFDIAQQKSAAKTFKELFNANLHQTGETTFTSNSFNVKLKGANTYEVTDKQGNLKLKFHEERFSGMLIDQSSLSGEEFKSIQKATHSVNSLGAYEVLQQDLAGRLNSLGIIAPESDHQIQVDLDTNAVATTAKSFLHYMGVSSWNRDGGKYEIQQSGGNLRIKANDSGQEILRIYNGKLSSRLKSKDIDFFRKLDSSMKVEVNKIRDKEKNLNLSSTLRSIPKINNQQELSR